MEKKQHFLLIFSITLKSETLDLWKVNTECNSILLCLFPQPGLEINTIELHKIKYGICCCGFTVTVRKGPQFPLFILTAPCARVVKIIMVQTLDALLHFQMVCAMYLSFSICIFFAISYLPTSPGRVLYVQCSGNVHSPYQDWNIQLYILRRPDYFSNVNQQS